jgi:ABC-type bacteriocin/lantibiotic exporter with double-glycine peptidase domain
VELNNVSATYEDGREVLTDVDLHAAPGQIVALVGPSGEGKSTLIRLILGLIDPVSGEGILRDETGAAFPLGADTRHLFAYVPQGNTVLAGSIAENLRLVNQSATEDQMVQALKDACAWDFVSQLPRGIHSPMGEGGKGFSEGQAQRIAIARALVRKAPVLLLDEMTSALDMETERQVLKNLMDRDVTCIVATHRPSVLALCHRVYRVNDGSVQLLTESEIQALQQFEA